MASVCPLACVSVRRATTATGASSEVATPTFWCRCLNEKRFARSFGSLTKLLAIAGARIFASNTGTWRRPSSKRFTKMNTNALREPSRVSHYVLRRTFSFINVHPIMVASEIISLGLTVFLMKLQIARYGLSGCIPRKKTPRILSRYFQEIATCAFSVHLNNFWRVNSPKSLNFLG